MRILKKNGMSEYFDTEKIKTSIINSAYDINFIVTNADIKILLHDIESRIDLLHGNDNTTSSYEVRGIIFHALIDNGFNKIAKSYMEVLLKK